MARLVQSGSGARRNGAARLLMMALLPILPLLQKQACAQAVTLTPSLTKIAGTDSSGAILFNLDYGQATSVALNTPNFVVFDALGNQYFSDTGGNCVRRIDTGGKISTIAGLIVGAGQGDTCNAAVNPAPLSTQGLLQPAGIALAPNGDLYIADGGHHCVRLLADKMTGTANMVTVAGLCSPTALLSQTPSPVGLALDSAGNLYIAINDSADSIFQVLQHAANAPAASECVMAGAPSVLVPATCSSVTNNAIALDGPSGLAIDAEGSLLLADTGNRCVRKVLGMTTIQTVVGQCTNDSSGPANFSLMAPFGLQFDETQALLISDGNQVLRHVPGSATRTLLAGLATNAAGPYDTTQDGEGGQNDPLNAPKGLAIDSHGNITIADSANHIVRQLHPNTVFSATPVGSSSSLQAITFDIDQNVNLSAAVGTDYSVTSNTCSGSLGYAGSSSPPNTCQVFVTFKPSRPGVSNAALVLSDSISNSQVIVGLQGMATGSQLQFFPGVVNTLTSGLANAADISVDIDENVYILEKNSGGATADIKELVASSGLVRSVVAAGSGLGANPAALARDSAGNLFVADGSAGNVARFGADGSVNQSYLTGLISPRALYVDAFDNLYVAQGGAAHNVAEFYSSGGQRIIAGDGLDPSANSAAATSALFVSPSGIFIDAHGVIYIADAGGHRVYAIDAAGIIHFIAGNGTTTTTDSSTPLGIGLVGPAAVAVDAAGDVFIADPPGNIAYVVFATSSQALKLAPIVGNGTAASTGDAGPSPAAEIDGPLGLTVDRSGNAYVIDSGASSVRKISYPQPTLNFGKVLAGATSPTQTVTLWNTGTDLLSQTAQLTISNPNFFEDKSPGVATCGSSLVAGGTCNLGFYFKPTGGGSQTGVANIANNSYLNPATVTLIANPLLLLPFNLPAETEIYGDAFPESVSLGLTGAAPTGTITFTTGTQTLCTFTGTMSATNVCAAPSSGLSVGTYPVAFSYSGDSTYLPITAATTLTVTPQPTVTTIQTSLTPVVAGTSVILTSSVTSALGAVTIGPVNFTAGSSTLGAGTLNGSGVATWTTTALPVGTGALQASYPGTLNYGPSSASLTEVVSAPTGTFTIAATPSTQFIRGAGSVTWQVAVTAAGGFAGPVALSCSGLPADASCSFAQGTLTLTAGSTVTTTMTTATTVADAWLRLRPVDRDQASEISCAFLLPFEMSGMGVLLSGFRRRKSPARGRGRLCVFVAMCFCILGLAGCNCFNTSYKTYTITVTGTSTLGGPPPQSATVQLSVGLQ